MPAGNASPTRFVFLPDLPEDQYTLWFSKKIKKLIILIYCGIHTFSKNKYIFDLDFRFRMHLCIVEEIISTSSPLKN